MKNIIQLTISLLLFFSTNTEAQATFSKQKNNSVEYSKKERLEKKSHKINLSFLKAHFENQKENKTFNPVFSMDILDENAILLMAIPSGKTLSAISEGLNLTIGLTITL